LADAIQRLVDNDAERREFGRRARRRIVEHFSLERAVDAFARVHREARSRSSP
jgi:glycosyltransferase involved in cell wall biosynthesis